MSTLLRRARLLGGPDGWARRGDPVDLRVDDGRVTAIGDGLSGDGAEVVDLDGRTVLPGLWDNHVHMAQWALARRRLDVSGARSAADTVALVASRLRDDPPAAGETLVGYGFRDALWPDAAHRDVLDPVAGDVPVVLVSGDLHCGWLSSAALDRFGHRGHPTGLIRESEWFAVGVALQDAGGSGGDTGRLDAFVDDAARAAAARGVVGIVDFEAPWSLPDWERRVGAGTDALRVVASVWPDRLDAAIGRGLRTGDAVGELVTAGPLKVVTDGSLNTRTAYCVDPWPGLEGTAHPCGLLLVPPEELAPLLRRAGDHGLDAAVHAIGDRANTLVLDAFAVTGARGRVEHAQLLCDGDVGRFAALGLVASVQPEHAMDDRDVADRLWEGRTHRSFVFRSLHDAGAGLALGSDAPVAPLDPWIAMAAAVHRTVGDRERWHPEQEIGRDVALEASAGPDGAVAPGRRADLVVVDEDPATCDRATLRAMPVAGTLLGGRWTHRAGSDPVRSDPGDALDRLVTRLRAASAHAVPWDAGRSSAAAGAGDADPLEDLVVVGVELPGGPIELLRPADPDLVPFEPVGTDGQEWHPAHWARLWPSATVLAAALCNDELDGARVLELGCGLGLPSIAAARSGARVLATDLSPAAVALTSVSAQRNGLDVDVAVADWTAPPDAVTGPAPWDLVVAADVLYGQWADGLLSDLLPRLVGADGAVLLTDPGREPAGRFLDAADVWDVQSRATGGGGVALHLLRPRGQ